MEEIILIDFKECIAECTTKYKVDLCIYKYKYALLSYKLLSYKYALLSNYQLKIPEPVLTFVGFVIIVMFIMQIFRSCGFTKNRKN